MRKKVLLEKGKEKTNGETTRNQRKTTPIISTNNPTKRKYGDERILFIFMSIIP